MPERAPFRARLRARRWDRLIGTSPASRRLEALIERAAAIDTTVLICGETGCGKEEVARQVHAVGARAGGPFVALNCGALSESLIESQLFGHEKGSFTGAYGSSQGVFRAADGGVVFLDEIGEMPLALQPRLLRVLQEREVVPLGSTNPVPFDVQMIIATHRNLRAAVAAGTFREDLYYRISTLEIEVPPLRDRATDIPLFIEHFCRHFAEKLGASPWEPDVALRERLLAYHWPGNVRQLAQAIERGYAFGTVPPLPAEQVAAVAPAPTPPVRQRLPTFDLESLRRLAVEQALEACAGHKGRAAGLLGVHINTMTRLVDDGSLRGPGRPSRGRPRKPR